MKIYCFHCGEPLTKSTMRPKVPGEFVYRCSQCTENPTVIETNEELDENDI